MAGVDVNVSNPADDDLINESLRDDELRAVLGALECQKDKDTFGLVCKRWLFLQSNERRKLSARAGPHMLKKMAARFTRLSHLDLSQSASRSFYPGVTDSDLSVIAASFVCLTSLDLHNCKGITDAGLVTIGSGLSTLQFLDVSDCKKLTGKGLSAVAAGCPGLQSLHLAGCKFVTDALLRALSSNCHHLEELGLQGCTNITDFGLVVLGEGCQRLKYLDINKCSNVGDMGVSSISKACSASLRTLKLLDCYRLGDESMLSVANFCKNLETLIIGGCRNISDESIKALAVACCVNLKVLRMDWCLNLSDSSLNCIFSRCKSLEILDIGCCNEVTDAAFQGLDTEGFELALKILKIDNCAKITVAGIELLLKSCKSLEYIDVRSCPHVTKTTCDEAALQFPACCKLNFTGSLADPDILI